LDRHLLSTGAASGSHGVRATQFSAQLGLLLSLLRPLAFSLRWCLRESRLRRTSRHVLASAASSVMPTCVLIWRLGACRLFCACRRPSHCVAVGMLRGPVWESVQPAGFHAIKPESARSRFAACVPLACCVDNRLPFRIRPIETGMDVAAAGCCRVFG
jgi:hypothetical protein